MNLKLILKLLFINYLIVNCLCVKKNNKKSNQDDDEDAFAEFDDFEDEQQQVKVKQTPSTPLQKQNLNIKEVDEEESDFEEISVESENDDEFEAFNDASKKEQQKTSQNEKPLDKTPPTQSPSQENQKKPKVYQTFNDNDMLDMEEFEHFVDEEEFEGYDKSASLLQDNDSPAPSKSSKNVDKSSSSVPIPNLKIADVPQHLINGSNWQNFYWEFIMISGILVYLINMLIGKNKNYNLANGWLQSHLELLQKNFALVGDDGSTTELPLDCKLIKESDHMYGVWCSGRQSCKSMFVQLKFLKRQDLVCLISKLIKPVSDQIIFSIEFDRNELDNFVFCLANKKISQNLCKDYQDLSTYCIEKKASNSFDIDPKYMLINEIGEVPLSVLDMRVCTFLNKHPDLLEYLLISDQYVGYKIKQDGDQAQAQTPVASSDSSLDIGLPNSRSIMIICLNIPGKGNTTIQDVEQMHELSIIPFIMYLIDKVSKIRLSKEAKVKAIKRRKEITEENLKVTHKQRQEAAQLRKEEKIRAEKEKVMNETDPEKQRKLEEKMNKLEKKRNNPKSKQIKIKSM